MRNELLMEKPSIFHRTYQLPAPVCVNKDKLISDWGRGRINFLHCLGMRGKSGPVWGSWICCEGFVLEEEEKRWRKKKAEEEMDIATRGKSKVGWSMHVWWSPVFRFWRISVLKQRHPLTLFFSLHFPCTHMLLTWYGKNADLHCLVSLFYGLYCLVHHCLTNIWAERLTPSYL